MMLRRTKAQQVLPVYTRFTERFNTPDEASKLTRNELEELLLPLGLRWRGKQLHSTIAYLKDNHALRTIGAADDLREIPGVGEYSDAMIRSLLFSEKIAAIDTNTVRIFSRIAGIPFRPDDRRDPRLIAAANRLVQSRTPARINLALIDLAALVCKPTRPECASCPLQRICKTGIDATTGTKPD